MTKFPIMLYNTKNTKKALVPPIPPPSSYEDAVGWSAIEAGYKTALRGSRKFTREAVLYDLYSEVNNVRLWRDLKKIEKTRQAGVSEYTPGKYRHRIIMEPKERSLHIPPLRERREDIPPLCRSLLDELSRKLKRRLELTPEALDRLLAHNWPGNVRELPISPPPASSPSCPSPKTSGLVQLHSRLSHWPSAPGPLNGRRFSAY